MIKALFGLIGYPLSHSFSKRYFTEKFDREHLTNHAYELFPLSSIEELPGLLKAYPQLRGLNVTIPYKQQVQSYLQEVDPEAAAVGAVNTIKITDKGLIGYNTDVYGFEESLKNFCPKENMKALVLGTGGASKAVQYVLNRLGIPFLLVSRYPESGDLIYPELNSSIMEEYHLLINTTPLGMAPHLHTCPSIPYSLITQNHYIYDLVYNPETTRFMEIGKAQGAAVKNGLEMLYLQAEKAWTIWTK